MSRFTPAAVAGFSPDEARRLADGCDQYHRDVADMLRAAVEEVERLTASAPTTNANHMR